jgi:arylsulfatase A-like enzyme
VLRQAGYATAAIGKWGLQGKPARGENAGASGRKGKSGKAQSGQWVAYPTERGFDFFFGYVRHKDGHFHYPVEDKREVWENDREVSAGMDLCYTTDLFTARAKKWIADQHEAKPDQPFFVYLAFDTPHAVLRNPPCAYPVGGGLRGGVQWVGRPGEMISTARGAKDAFMHPDYASATWDDGNDPATPQVPWPDVQRRYANDVRRIDDCVGDLRQLLVDLKIDDDTLVIFTSDNGPSLESYLKGEEYRPTFFHGFGPFDGVKRDVLEGGERAPALVCWPGTIPAGRVDAQPSGQWDWLATFADLAGVPVPAASDGVSLVPGLIGTGARRASTLYVEYFHDATTPDFNAFAPSNRGRARNQMQAIYLDGYKGLRYDIKSADDDFAIFDLAKDQEEANDLAKDPAMAGLEARMKARVLQVRKPDPSAPRPYDQAYVPPTTEPATATGLTCARYAGEWPWMPDFRTLKPQSSRTVMRIDAGAVQGGGGGGVQGLAFAGFVRIPHDGMYTFTLETDTGAMLFLHDIRVIDEPIRDSAGTFHGDVRLGAGWHPIRLYYRHTGAGEAHLSLKCADEQGNELKLEEGALRQPAPGGTGKP